MSENVENKKEKAKKIGAIVLSAVLVSGVGYGTYSKFVTPTESDKNKVVTLDDEEKDLPIIIKKDDDSDIEFVAEDDQEAQRQAKDFSHLDEFVINEAKKKLANQMRDVSYLESIALQHAEEVNKGQGLIRDDEGLLVFEAPKKDSSLGDLLVMGDSNDDDIVIVLPMEDDPEVEKPLDPVIPEPKPVEPEPEPSPSPTPEPKPEPVDPNPIDPEPEKPTDPEPVKPTDPEPVFTTDIVTKTETIPFQVEQVEDPTLEKGEKRVVRDGKNGNKEIKIKVTYKDGKEMSREKVEESILVKPINEIILVGTKDFSELKSLVDKMEELNKDDYTDETWSIFIEELDYAKNVLGNKESTQENINISKENLQAAYDLLEKVVNFDGLKVLVAEIESLDAELYTTDSWDNLLNILVNANNVLVNVDATQKEVDVAREALQGAFDLLELIEDNTENPEVTDGDGDGDEESNSTDEKEDDPLENDSSDGSALSNGDQGDGDTDDAEDNKMIDELEDDELEADSEEKANV